MRVLAGDIGGTNARFMIADVEAKYCRACFSLTLPSREYLSFDSALTAFLEQADDWAREIVAACFAIAGPVAGVGSRITNLAWELDSTKLRHKFRLGQVHLINDFEAVGWGLEDLEAKDIHNLQAGNPVEQGPRALIGAGTGLGQALMTWCRDHYLVHATEGGHTDFAPQNDLQIALLRYLLQRYTHVSYEHILSGSGLENIFDFLREYGTIPSTPALTENMQTGGKAASISHFALREADPLAMAALDLFIAIYGAQAGNLALTCMPRGGLFVAGGIATKILPRLTKGAFMKGFLHKGRMGALLESIPVKVILKPDIGLRGGALAAWHLSNFSASTRNPPAPTVPHIYGVSRKGLLGQAKPLRLFVILTTLY